MRYLCLLVIVLLLPVTATAQRQNDRRSDDRRSQDRGADVRKPDHRRSDQKAAPSNPNLPWWEQQRTPAWEQKQTPWWEKQGVPTWERAQVPWSNTNTTPTDLSRDRVRNQRQNSGNHKQDRRDSGPDVIYVVPYRYFPNTLPGSTQFVVTPPPPAQAVAPTAPPPPAPLGFLRLDVEPKESLQIFVDGVYIGSPFDLGDEIALPPGTRKIELRARGYKTLAFSVEIVEDRSINYRDTLDRDEAAPQASPLSPAIAKPAATPGSRTMYLIPGCYLGNVSPKGMALRPGCDISKLQTITP